MKIRFNLVFLLMTLWSFVSADPTPTIGLSPDAQLKSRLYSAFLQDRADLIEKNSNAMLLNLKKSTTQVQIPEVIKNLNLTNPPNETNILTSSTYPKFFEVLKSEIMDPICSTKTGAKLCLSTSGSDLKRNLGETSRLAIGRRDRTGLLRNINIILSSEPVQFYGFTVDFKPWLFLDLEKISRDQLIRLLVHEMFQVVDIKNQIHLSPAIRSDLLGEQVGCQEFDFLLDHRLRLGLSHVRAVRVEEIVLKELGLLSTSTKYENMTCVQLITEEFKTLKLDSRVLNKLYYHEANLFFSSRNSCPLPKTFTQYNEMPRSVLEQAVSREKISRLDQIEVRDESFNHAESLCQFLIRPDLSRRRLWLSQFLLPSMFQGPKMNPLDVGPIESEPGQETDLNNPNGNGPRPVGDKPQNGSGPRPLGD